MSEIAIPGTSMTIGGDRVFVIAEIGKNFIQEKEERSVSEYVAAAKELVDAAKKSGCDAVKFQTHNVDDEQATIEIVSPHFKGSDRYSWLTRNTRATPRKEFWEPLKAYCDEKGILFFSTPMSRGAAQKIDDLVSLWKVGSGDVEDYVLLDYLSKTGKPVIMSTGMVSRDELDTIMRDYSSTAFILLYCISQYPCPKEAFNLSTIHYLKEKYPTTPIGFSDHSIGHDAALAAVACGATVIEKHFSFSRDLWGADHKVSMTPAEMTELVAKIRNKDYASVDVTPFLGDKDKEFEGAENQFRPYFKKTLVAAQSIPEGTVLTEDMIHALRPQQYLLGVPSQKLHDIIGTKTKRALDFHEVITYNDVA